MLQVLRRKKESEDTKIRCQDNCGGINTSAKGFVDLLKIISRSQFSKSFEGDGEAVALVQKFKDSVGCDCGRH